eukprot:537824-Rhodomonas_salina.1
MGGRDRKDETAGKGKARKSPNTLMSECDCDCDCDCDSRSFALACTLSGQRPQSTRAQRC